MNSYYKQNRDYREQYELEKEAGVQTYSSKYPSNINIHDFFMFMLHPTFVYQDSYPLSNEFTWPKFIFRVSILLIGLVRPRFFILL